LDIDVWLKESVYNSAPILVWYEYSENQMWVKGCNKLNPLKNLWGFYWGWVCKAPSHPLHFLYGISRMLGIIQSVKGKTSEQWWIYDYDIWWLCLKLWSCGCMNHLNCLYCHFLSSFHWMNKVKILVLWH